MLTKDQLLRYATPDETAADFLSRQVSEAVSTGLFCIDQHVKLRPGQVLELAGPTGTGKTELLAQVRCGWRGGGGWVRHALMHGSAAPAACPHAQPYPSCQPPRPPFRSPPTS
jgi:hypothetical protein